MKYLKTMISKDVLLIYKLFCEYKEKHTIAQDEHKLNTVYNMPTTMQLQ